MLALLLIHDHLIAKKGIAAPANHALRQAVERHKARLRAEFTKARVRRGCASVETLKDAVRKEKIASLGPQAAAAAIYPRWVRVNNIQSTVEQQLATTFAGYQRVEALSQLVGDNNDSAQDQGKGSGIGDKQQRRLRLDPHIPDLLAIAPGMDFTSSQAYKNGEIILQDKASCFPAYLLLGDDETWQGTMIDGCAAPGNKTTHMASLLAKQSADNRIFSIDASPARAKTLQKMVSAAHANSTVTVLAGQDFLALDPEDPRFADVTRLLLDPSCSGSGIIGRDDVPKLVLPGATASSDKSKSRNQSKKRKRRHDDETDNTGDAPADSTITLSTSDENELASSHLDPERLNKLSNLQTRIVEHALEFPAATHITYSTCSIHMTENESVVSRVLASDVAKRRGWRVMRRDEQPAGLREWPHRGIRTEPVEKDNGSSQSGPSVDLSDQDLEGCLRCWPGDDEGLGGFFVAGFVRDGRVDNWSGTGHESDGVDDEEGDSDSFEGFSD